MEGKSDTHSITIGHIYFCCYLVPFILVWFVFCCLQSVRFMSTLAVVIVVFSWKCLTFQAQQAVIDILNPIKCGPRPQVGGCNPFFSLTVHVYLTGSQENGNEPLVMLRCHSGFPSTTPGSRLTHNLPYPEKPVIVPAGQKPNNLTFTCCIISAQLTHLSGAAPHPSTGVK